MRLPRSPGLLRRCLTAKKREAKSPPKILKVRLRADTPASSNGPWVINLISSPDKAYVERFSRKSGAANQNAELNSATVNGRQYWRLQIAGFESYSRRQKTCRNRQAGTRHQGRLDIQDRSSVSSQGLSLRGANACGVVVSPRLAWLGSNPGFSSPREVINQKTRNSGPFGLWRPQGDYSSLRASPLRGQRLRRCCLATPGVARLEPGVLIPSRGDKPKDPQ